jgi:hypothetical protein
MPVCIESRSTNPPAMRTRHCRLRTAIQGPAVLNVSPSMIPSTTGHATLRRSSVPSCSRVATIASATSHVTPGRQAMTSAGARLISTFP